MKINNRQEPLMRINTKKYSAIPLKDLKKESIMITTARRSSVRPHIPCDVCGTLTSRNHTHKCNECTKNLCTNCSQLKKGRYYCSSCL